MNDLMNLLKERRTYRRFCQKPISEEILAEILTAARYASSAANKQPLSYVVVKTPQKVQEVLQRRSGRHIFRRNRDSRRLEKSRCCLSAWCRI